MNRKHGTIKRIGSLVAAICLSLLASTASVAQSADIADYEANAQDVLRILGIRHLGATVRLPQEVRYVALRLEFFKDGRKIVGGPHETFGMGTVDASDTFDVSVEVADTDKTAFAGAPKNHQRIFAKVKEQGLGGTETATHFDVPKSQFNAEFGGASGRIGASAQSGEADEMGRTVVPLLYYLTGDSNERRSMDTFEKTLAANPDADVLLVTLLYDPKPVNLSKNEEAAR